MMGRDESMRIMDEMVERDHDATHGLLHRANMEEVEEAVTVIENVENTKSTHL
jgi:hypothetical protein